MREIVRWPLWIWFLVLGLDLSIVLAIWAALGNFAAWIALIVSLFLSGFFYQFTGLRIQVTNEKLQIGRANIERRFLGTIEILNDAEMRYLRGPGINPKAFLALRFWVKGGVKLTINDERDPTPYWLISTKNPEKLLQVLKD